MAKICINCGRKITFMMDQFSMVHTGKSFCSDCMGDAKKMLEPIKILVNRDRLPEVKEEFKHFLSHSDYSDEIRQLIRTEFEQISGEFANDSVYQVKRFAASFEESFEAIKNVGIYLTGETVQCNPPVIAVDNVNVTTFVFEQYFFRNGSYASLNVTLVNSQGISTVTTVGSGGGSGIMNLSWGAEEDFVNGFWHAFRKSYPQFELEELQIASLNKDVSEGDDSFE